MTNESPCDDCGEEMELVKFSHFPENGDCPICDKKEEHAHTDKKELKEFLLKEKEKLKWPIASSVRNQDVTV